MIIRNNYIDGEGKILFYNCSQKFLGNCIIINNTFLLNQEFDKNDYDLIISTPEKFNSLTIKNCVFIRNQFYDDKIPNIKKLSELIKYHRKEKLKKIKKL